VSKYKIIAKDPYHGEILYVLEAKARRGKLDSVWILFLIENNLLTTQGIDFKIASSQFVKKEIDMKIRDTKDKLRRLGKTLKYLDKNISFLKEKLGSQLHKMMTRDITLRMEERRLEELEIDLEEKSDKVNEKQLLLSELRSMLQNIEDHRNNTPQIIQRILRM
jgi:hypothetical protein